MSIVLSTNIAGQECIYDNCGDCRACGENPNRVMGCDGKGGFYTVRPESIARYKKLNDYISDKKYLQLIHSWDDWRLGPFKPENLNQLKKE